MTLLAEWPDAALARLGLDRFTAVAALTHDPKIDDPGLDAALRARMLLRRRARLAEDPRGARGPAGRSAGHADDSDRPDPGADRSRHRAPCRRPRSPSRCCGEVVGALRRKPTRAEREGPRPVRFGPVPVGRGREGGVCGAHGVQALGEGGEADRGEEGRHRHGRRRRRRWRAPASVRSWWRDSTPGDVGENPAALTAGRGRGGTGPCGSSAPSRAAPTCSPRRRACCWSTPRRSSASNAVDERLTLATLPPFRAVEPKARWPAP